MRTVLTQLSKDADELYKVAKAAKTAIELGVKTQASQEEICKQYELMNELMQNIANELRKKDNTDKCKRYRNKVK